MTGRPRVLIADAQPMMRTSIRRLLERDGFAVCGEAPDAETAVGQALRERPDVCVVDVLLPGSGIRAIKEISAELSATAVVALTASRQGDHLIDAITAGATGYLLKDMNSERLPHALRGVLAGEAAIPRPLVARLITELQSHGSRRAVITPSGRVDLTAREWEVIRHLCDGLGASEIGERLFVSPVTVRRHISQILAKLGVESREEAVGLVRGQI